VAAVSSIVGVKTGGLWYPPKAARAAERERNALLDAMSQSLSYGAGGCRPHLGPLSRGCRICENGGWACNFINRLCTRDCDFCKRYHRTIAIEPEPETAGVVFADPARHVDYLKTFHIEGVGFSGGEPLLVPDRLLSHINAIRNEFGSEMYIWMYTNGDLVDEAVLGRLREAGLDEIRFNIAARGYDLAPVKLARRWIQTITVEIPALPRDFETVRSLLPDLRAVGVDHLNLHQLTLEQQNYRGVLNHHQHFVTTPVGIAVFESELCALSLMRAACDLGLDLPVNYCSRTYKDRFQSRGLRKQAAGAVVAPYEQITDAGYIRTLEVSDSAETIEGLLVRARAAGRDPRLWQTGHHTSAVLVHPILLPLVDWSSGAVIARYWDPMPVRNGGALKERHRVRVSGTGVPRQVVDRWRRISAGADGGSIVADALLESASLLRGRAAAALRTALDYERLERGMPEVS
jgi:pyruvate formate-lyase activating enzyme-like uncharacterized protein